LTARVFYFFSARPGTIIQCRLTKTYITTFSNWPPDVAFLSSFVALHCAFQLSLNNLIAQERVGQQHIIDNRHQRRLEPLSWTLVTERAHCNFLEEGGLLSFDSSLSNSSSVLATTLHSSSYNIIIIESGKIQEDGGEDTLHYFVRRFLPLPAADQLRQQLQRAANTVRMRE
jgi:hypothetical protein